MIWALEFFLQRPPTNLLSIIGPQLFISDEEPTYDTAFRAIMICYALVICLIAILRVYLQLVNKRRQREEGIQGSAGASGAVGGGKVVDIADTRNMTEAANEIQLRPEDYEDTTDWNSFGFRYRL